MSTIPGLLGLQDNDRSFVDTVGQALVAEATETVLQQHRRDVDVATRLFIQEVTEDYKERYKLPGGGRLQELSERSAAGARKRIGSYDVAYPIREYGDAIGGNRVALAYMTVGEYAKHVDGVRIADMNTMRFNILKKIFNNTNESFADEIRGTLTVKPLANGDADLYSPVLGSEDEAVESHYLESNYAASAIDDTNNPLPTMREELVEHFGESQGGENIYAFFNPAQQAKIEALTDFDPVNDRYIRPGANADVPFGMPAESVPGLVIGRSNGVWVVVWRFIPPGYSLAIHADAPAPLKMRVDLAATKLPRGLTLVAEREEYPLKDAQFSHRYGIGAGNRLNGVVMEFGTGGTYTIPTIYQ